jgi:hypothetical protein
MKKSEYADLTRLGVRARLEQLQNYLADIFSDFPEEFNSQTPPLFLKAEEKAGGNTWPAFRAVESNGSEPEPPTPAQRKWSPEARRKASERMLNRHASGQWGTLIWHRMNDYMLKQKKAIAKVSVMATALKVHKSSIDSAIRRDQKRFKRIGNGLYQLARPATNAERSQTTVAKAVTTKHRPKAKHIPHHWGEYHWQKIHDYLRTVDNQTAPIGEIMKALKIPTQASAITSMQGHKNLFRRVSPGTYALIKEAPEATSSGE